MDSHKVTRIVGTIIGVVIGIVVLVFGFKLFQSTFSRAEDVAPHDVVVTDISQNSAKVTWATGEANQGVVEYGTSPTALNFFAPEPSPNKTHSIDLTLLSPATVYYFQIRITDKKYDNGGVPWTFTTKSTEKTKTTNVEPTSAKPSPVATIVIPPPTTAPASTSRTCSETDCAKIKEKLGNGCSVKDYVECIGKQTPTPSP